MSTNETKHEYEIGGICVTMTAAQAAAWNEGEFLAPYSEYEGATIYVPGHAPDRSRLRNGEVEISFGLPTSETYDLAEVLRMDELPAALLALEGNPANLIRIR